jgi:hypothetical protein
MSNEELPHSFPDYIITKRLSSSFLGYIVTKRRRPPRASTLIGDLWVRSISFTGNYSDELGRVSQFLTSPEGSNLNAAQLVNLALMAESSQWFDFALGLWANAYKLEDSVDAMINPYVLAFVVKRDYLAQLQGESSSAQQPGSYYHMNRDAQSLAQRRIQAAIARQEEFQNYLLRVKFAARITGDIRERWESRIVSNNWHQAGAEGARLYLQRYGRNVKSPKLYGLAAISEEMGYPALAYGFWAAAYKLDTSEEAPPYVDTSQPAVGSANFEPTYSERVPPTHWTEGVPPIRWKPMHPEEVPPPQEDNPPELEEGGYWDERFKGVDI